MKKRNIYFPDPKVDGYKLFQAKPEPPQTRLRSCWKKLRLVSFVLIGWMLSLFIALRIVVSPVNAVVLQRSFKKDFNNRTDLAWIGHIVGLMSYILIPLICGLIDIASISYRFAMLVSTMLFVVGNLGSAGAGHPIFLIFTECFVTGIGSAITFSVIILTLDTYFPEPSRFRIIATTLCQGSVVGSFLFSEFLSKFILGIGWGHMQVVSAAIGLFLGAIFILLIPEEGFNPFSHRPLYDPRHEEEMPWQHRIFGMSSLDIDESPTVVLWFLSRLLTTTTHIGIFAWLLRVTDISRFPEISLVYGWRSAEMIMAYAFSTGQTLTYIVGGICGSVRGRGHLVKVYAAASLPLFFCLLIWQLVYSSPKSLVTYIMMAVVAFVSGSLLGLQETFLFAATQEATQIHPRRSFPFSQMMNGVAYVLSPIIDALLNQFHYKINLIVYSIFSIINFIIFICNLHRIHRRRVALDPFAKRENESSPTNLLDSSELFRDKSSAVRGNFLSSKVE